MIIKHPDFSKTFYLQTDASNIALGAKLYDQQGEGQEHLTIAFTSSIFLVVKKNYTITENDLLSVVFAVNKLQTYYWRMR